MQFEKGTGMSEQNYGNYFLREPWGKPVRANIDPNAPVYIGIGQGVPWQGGMSRFHRSCALFTDLTQ
jgi:hypothetical protein